jgi:hypothetical protein
LGRVDRAGADGGRLHADTGRRSHSDARDARFTCDAAKVQSMIGQVATRRSGGEAVRTAGARTMRRIEPDSAYTMDYRPDRLNIHVDARGRVTKINCG